MDIRRIKDSAANSLAQASYNPKKLALLHAGVMALFALVLTVLQFLLDKGIANTGGLGSMGSRAILSTAQSMLSIVNVLALPFWQMGMVFAGLTLCRNETATPADLTEGFRRWGPLSRLLVLQIGIYILASIVCSQVAGTLFFLSPFLSKSLPIMQQFLEEAAQAGQTTVTTEAFFEAFLPLYGISLVVMAVVMIPIFYRLRMSFFAIMDDAPRARAAMRVSNRLMKRSCLSLFQLDLSFWWYYGAKLLISLVAYLHLILPAVGIRLPVSNNVSFFIFYGIYLVLLLAVEWQFGAYVQTAYAHFYNIRKADAPELPTPQTQPWTTP